MDEQYESPVVYRKHCKPAFIGIAMFYLRGTKTRDNTIWRGAWRVTAVWVHESGVWKGAHHHESPLVTRSQP